MKSAYDYVYARPLLHWLLTSMLAATVIFGLFYLIPGPRKPGMILLLLSTAIGPTTRLLWKRFADHYSGRNTIRESQLRWTATMALGSSVIAASFIPALLVIKHMGSNVLADRTGITPVIIYTTAVLLSIIFGYAGRQLKLAQIGLKLCTLSLIVGLIVVLSHSPARLPTPAM